MAKVADRGQRLEESQSIGWSAEGPQISVTCSRIYTESLSKVKGFGGTNQIPVDLVLPPSKKW